MKASPSFWSVLPHDETNRVLPTSAFSAATLRTAGAEQEEPVVWIMTTSLASRVRLAFICSIALVCACSSVDRLTHGSCRGLRGPFPPIARRVHRKHERGRCRPTPPRSRRSGQTLLHTISARGTDRQTGGTNHRTTGQRWHRRHRPAHGRRLPATSNPRQTDRQTEKRLAQRKKLGVRLARRHAGERRIVRPRRGPRDRSVLGTEWRRARGRSSLAGGSDGRPCCACAGCARPSAASSRPVGTRPPPARNHPPRRGIRSPRALAPHADGQRQC